MLEVSHVAVAGLIARKIPSFWISLPLIFISHHLLDCVPHWDTGTGVRSGEKTKAAAIRDTLIDLGLATILFYFFFQKPASAPTGNLWPAAFTAVLPDIIEFPALFLDFKPFPINYLEKFHLKLHRRLNLPWGLLIQLPFIIGAIMLANSLPITNF